MNLKRREFIGLAGALGATALTAPAIHAAEAASGARSWIELRRYTFASAAKREAFEAFFGQTAIPAFNRAGCKPVGAFRLDAADNPKLAPPPDGTELYVVIPHAGAESVANTALALDKDAVYREAGRAFIEAARKDPAYVKVETTLMQAFAKVPAIEVPSTAATRVVQLRTYTNHNDDRALRKAEMFDVGGEIEIFRRTGLRPVFFGRALSGWALPNLTYMLGFDSPEQLAANWKTFVSDPEWKALKVDARYADCEPTIVNLILRPVSGSQI